MPLDRRAAFQLGLLLLAVPAQFLVSKYLSSSQTQRSYALQSLIKTATGFRNQYLSLQAWRKWCVDLLHRVKSMRKDGWHNSDFAADDQGESPAIEVMRYRDPDGYFAGSPEPRSPRPPEIKYRIGQVVKHKRWGYRGVIIGWDAEARAPEQWLQQMHPPDKPHWKKQPNYSILVDTRDRLDVQTTYVPQENIDIIVNTQSHEKLPYYAILVDTRDRLVPQMTYEPEGTFEVVNNVQHWRLEPNYVVLADTRDRPTTQRTYVAEENIQIISNTRVFHPELDNHFEAFDGAQYIARPWLKSLYPHDQ